MNSKVKILVAFHKPYQVINDEEFVSIHVGRKIYEEKTKDGKISSHDNKWLMTNLIGDDTGKNISDKNREYCELTAIYWAWKNYDKIGNPEYIGLMHYRRHFLFNYDAKTYLNSFFNNKYNCRKYIDNIVNNYDIVMPKRFQLKHKKYSYTPYTWYKVDRTFHHIEDYEKILEIVKRKYPEYTKTIEKYNNLKYGYGCNMFVMKKEIFFEYCSWLFDILETAEKEINVSKYKNIEEKRVLARLSEWLTGIFFVHISDRDIKSIEIPVIDVPEKYSQSYFRKFLNVWHKLKPIYF